MRLVGTVGEEILGRRVVDYLLTQNIPTALRQSQSGWGVWVENEHQLEQGQRELSEFLSNPNDPKYQSAARPASQLRRQIERAERAHQKNTIALRDQVGRVSIKRCPVVHLLILGCLAVAVFSNGGKDRMVLMPLFFSPSTTTEQRIDLGNGQVFVRTVPLYKSAGLEPIRRGEIWRLWTPMFIHFGMMHLIFNAIALYWFGGMIELRKSSLVLIGLVLASAPVSSLAQYLWQVQTDGPNAWVASGGMSGVVYALFGYVWMKSDYEPESHLRISSNSIAYMLIWLVLCMTGWLGSIGNAAHLSGLVFGMCVGLTPHLWRGLRRA